MIFMVNNKSISINNVTYRDLNHGRPVSNSNIFNMLIPLDFVVTVFNDYFEKFRLEIIEDYNLTGDKEPERYYRENWPNLKKLIDSNISIFEEIIKDYLYIEFLEAIIPDSKSECLFVINDINHVSVKDKNLCIQGTGFKG